MFLATPGSHAKCNGFTLVELVVSLSIIGLALGAGYSALSTIIDLRTSSAERNEKTLRAAAIRHALREWIAGARLSADPAHPPFRGLDGVHEDASDDALSFLSAASTPIEARVSLIRLFVDHSPETPEQGLVAEFDDADGRARSVLEIEPRVAELEIRFLSGVTGQPQWLPSWISSSVLPRAVEVRMLSSGGEELPDLLALPLLVPIAGGR
jgi:prepilin-type N-terminal cleavage/methylation domain-containing protein